jgi:hypothetical protein
MEVIEMIGMIKTHASGDPDKSGQAARDQGALCFCETIKGFGAVMN